MNFLNFSKKFKKPYHFKGSMRNEIFRYLYHKYEHYLCVDNYKTLTKEIKDPNKWRKAHGLEVLMW